MAVDRHSVIGYFTKGLSRDLAVSIYQEYHSRIEKIDVILKGEKYVALSQSRSAVDLLLAASIFHKRVISNMDAAGKFFRKVTSRSEAETVKIGGYVMTGEERNKILGAVISFNSLMKRYNIPKWFFEYYSNEDFLNRVIRLKYAETEK